MDDLRRGHRKWYLVMAAIAFCVLGLLTRERIAGKISLSEEPIVLIALFGAFAISTWLLRSKATNKSITIGSITQESMAAANEQKRKLIRKRKRFIGYLLVAFTVSEWLIRDDAPLLRLVCAVLGLCFIGWKVWLLMRLERSFDQNPEQM